jgi:hypothetical protein
MSNTFLNFPRNAQDVMHSHEFTLEMDRDDHAISAEALALDEFQTLSREKDYLRTALGVLV